MSFLVTGGMGFIGYHTINHLSQKFPNERIFCLDNLSLSEEKPLPSNVTFVRGDVRDAEKVDELVKVCEGGIIHLAADSRVLPSLHDPTRIQESISSNIVGTANILISIAKSGKKTPFVYAGSSTAYGDHPVPQNETLLPRIQSPYSATKLSGELLIKSFVTTFELAATTLRYFQVYGPGQPVSGPYALVTGIFVKQAKLGQPLTVEGSGEQRRDFIHVFDVARANVLALSVNSKGEPINIGTGKSYSIRQLANLISEEQVFLPARKIDLPATEAEVTLAKSLLNWESSITLEDGIAELLNDN